jgi:type IV secretory pathway ATPase VirB11/archaellum biosynthesis ATPase
VPKFESGGFEYIKAAALFVPPQERRLSKEMNRERRFTGGNRREAKIAST